MPSRDLWAEDQIWEIFQREHNVEIIEIVYGSADEKSLECPANLIFLCYSNNLFKAAQFTLHTIDTLHNNYDFLPGPVSSSLSFSNGFSQYLLKVRWDCRVPNVSKRLLSTSLTLMSWKHCITSLSPTHSIFVIKTWQSEVHQYSTSF